jgi:hypothetical protein
MNSKIELLSNIDLQFYCNKLKIPIKAVTFKDLYKYIKPENGGAYIINIDDSTSKKYGTHWTCLIIVNSYALYWDSFGLPIPTSIKIFIQKNKCKKIYYSIDQIQKIDSILCGYYVLYFLYFITVLNKRCNKYKYLINRHNSIYSLENRYLNDRILQNLIKNIFN